MHFSAVVTLLAGASTAFAVPAMRRQASLLCSGLESNPQCCATDVLGVADLNCIDRMSYLTAFDHTSLTCYTAPSQPTDVQNFVDLCASIGQEAECCALPVVSFFVLLSCSARV